MNSVETCSIDGCNSPVKSRGWCGKHLQRWYRFGTTDDPVRSETRICRECDKALPRRNFRTAIPVCEWCYPNYMRKTYGSCGVEDCNKTVKARRLCDKHLQRWYRWGTTDLPERADTDQCIRCKEIFPRKEFPNAKERACKDCYPMIRQERTANRVSRSKDTARKVREFREAQGGRCAICDIPEEESPKKRLHVDHDHNSLVIRGLLCGNCNLGLGHFKDNSTLLQAAIGYLQSSSSPS
jgi:recombination endonuclease VII